MGWFQQYGLGQSSPVTRPLPGLSENCIPSSRTTPDFGTGVRQTLVLGTLFALGFGQQRMKPKIFDKNSTFGIGRIVVRRGKNYIWFETVLLWFFIFRWDLNYNTHIYLILYNIIILIDYGFLKKGVKKKSFG